MKTKERAIAILEKLCATYPDAHCELNFSGPLELLVATILSAQCTDRRVNLVTATLFKKYRSAQDYASVPQAELEQEIKSTGFYRAKARNIRLMAQHLVDKHQGVVPASMEALTGLAGVGRKTANVVLGNAFRISEGIVVDTHVSRLARRFRLTGTSDPEKIEHDLIRLVPRQHWTMVSHWLIWHGRRRCYARNPDCLHCEVADLCPSFNDEANAKRAKPMARGGSRVARRE